MADQLPKPFVKALSDKIEAIRIREGIDVTKDNSELLSKLRDRIDWPEGFRISSLNDFFRKRQKNPNAVLKFVPQGTDKGNKVRQVLSDRPGGELFSRKGGIPYLRRQGKTKEFLNFIDNLGYDDALIEKYFWEMDRDIRKILKEIKDVNSKLPKGSDQKVSYGHLHRLSKSIDSPRNLFVELLTENVDKGNRYSLNPAGQLATGNPIKEGATWLENWKNDFLIYADRIENGGTGVLPQRGQYSNLLEQKFRELTGTQWDKLDEAGKASAIDDINDLIHDTEKLNQFTVKQSDELRKWGLLNPDQYEHGLAWFNDREYRKTLGKPTGEVTELGRRLGGIGDTISTKPDNHLFRNTLAVGLKKINQVKNLPGVKPTLEVLDTVRKNPVVATVSTLPILSAFDIAEAATSGVKLYQNQWDTQDEELAKREKLAEQLKFTAGTAGVSSLTPAGFVTGPISLISGATALVLENRNNREKTKRALVDARINKKVPVANDHLDKDLSLIHI